MTTQEKKRKVVNPKSTEVTITAVSEDLVKACKLAASITKANKITLLAKNKHLYVHSMESEAIEIEVSNAIASVDEEVHFSVTLSVFLGILKKRKILELTYNPEDNAVAFSSVSSKSNYIGSISTLPVYYQIFEITETSSLPISKDIHDAVTKALSLTGLNDIHSQNELDVHIKINEEGLVALCLDDFHIAYYKQKDLSAEQEIIFSVPSTILTIINKLDIEDGYDIIVDNACFYAYNDRFKLSIPLRQEEDGVNISLTVGEDFINNLPRKLHTVFKINTTILANTINNIVSIHNDGDPVLLEVIEGNLHLSLKNSIGEVREEIALDSKYLNSKGDIKALFNPYLILNILELIPNEDFKFCLPKPENGELSLMYFKTTLSQTHLLYSISLNAF